MEGNEGPEPQSAPGSGLGTSLEPQNEQEEAKTADTTLTREVRFGRYDCTDANRNNASSFQRQTGATENCKRRRGSKKGTHESTG